MTPYDRAEKIAHRLRGALAWDQAIMIPDPITSGTDCIVAIGRLGPRPAATDAAAWWQVSIILYDPIPTHGPDAGEDMGAFWTGTALPPPDADTAWTLRVIDTALDGLLTYGIQRRAAGIANGRYIHANRAVLTILTTPRRGPPPDLLRGAVRGTGPATPPPALPYGPRMPRETR